MKDYRELYEKSFKIRKHFLELFTELGHGHLTTAFSETEIMTLLLERIIRYDENRLPIDKFVLSKGHGAGLMYPILEDMGIIDADQARALISKGGDVDFLKKYCSPGFEFYGGSLGIGIGLACGLALGYKQSREDRMVYCLLGDAENYEGSVWEAMLFAPHYRLNNLVVILDRNYLGCSDFTENMCELEPLEDKWRSCNWDCVSVNGHSYEELDGILSNCRNRRSSRPLCIIAKTSKGKGLSYTENIPLNHGYMPKGEAARKALELLEFVE